MTQHRQRVGDIAWHRSPSPASQRPLTSSAQACQLGQPAFQTPRRPQETAGCAGDLGWESALYLAQPPNRYQHPFPERAMGFCQ